LTDEKACKAMVEEAAQRLGRLDILVNNAGTNIRKAPQDYSLEEWRQVLDTNLTSAFLASQAAYPHTRTWPVVPTPYLEASDIHGFGSSKAVVAGHTERAGLCVAKRIVQA
jgi:NAD(P)-dependent dehydrogenase (short-subunit alcohol dehydrogenase family)